MVPVILVQYEYKKIIGMQQHITYYQVNFITLSLMLFSGRVVYKSYEKINQEHNIRVIGISVFKNSCSFDYDS